MFHRKFVILLFRYCCSKLCGCNSALTFGSNMINKSYYNLLVVLVGFFWLSTSVEEVKHIKDVNKSLYISYFYYSYRHIND